MRRILLFSVVVSTMIMAGGDIAPVEQAPEVAQGAFYVGAGYSNIQGIDRQNYIVGDMVGVTQTNGFAPYETDFDADGVMFQAGYKFNPYMAIEGRYTMSVGDVNLDNAGNAFIKTSLINEDLNADITNLAIYIKPMYPFGNASIYALLGYGKVKFDNNTNGTSWDDNSFQWGLGASYAFNDHFSVFADGVRWYHDNISEGIVLDGLSTIDRKIYAFSVGLTYTF
jgi:opacity protein-like surface antigen